MLFKYKTSTAEASPLKPLVSTLLVSPVPFNVACLLEGCEMNLLLAIFPTGLDHLPILRPILRSTLSPVFGWFFILPLPLPKTPNFYASKSLEKISCPYFIFLFLYSGSILSFGFQSFVFKALLQEHLPPARNLLFCANAQHHRRAGAERSVAAERPVDGLVSP